MVFARCRLLRDGPGVPTEHAPINFVIDTFRAQTASAKFVMSRLVPVERSAWRIAFMSSNKCVEERLRVNVVDTDAKIGHECMHRGLLPNRRRVIEAVDVPSDVAPCSTEIDCQGR